MSDGMNEKQVDIYEGLIEAYQGLEKNILGIVIIFWLQFLYARHLQMVETPMPTLFQPYKRF